MSTHRQWISQSRIWLALALMVAVGVIWLLAHRRDDPVYRAKTLTQWVRTYASSSSSTPSSAQWKEADDAIRHIGTNGIPLLLHMLRERDSKLKLRLIAFAQKQHRIKIHFLPDRERNVAASRAFIALGDTARDAVPALIKIFDQNISVESQAAIEDSLAWIGPSSKPAVALLSRAATNSNPRVRANAFWALGEIHAEPSVCVPALIRALGDTNDWVRLSAAHALGMFGADAQSAIPRLTELKNRSESSYPMIGQGIQVMLEAANALRKISPPAIAPTNETFSGFGISTGDWRLPP